ncbi:MAG: type II secretion system F family protein [Pirellulales bacterium]|nr:type II secretion system F family protein [Pirellulales bacterium]MBX3434575.1 type II secretion system F family protein [Pirellulales bacterium]
MHALIAGILSPTMMTQIAIFGAVAAAAWWLLDLLQNGRPRAEQRLEEFREPNGRKSDLLRDGRGKSGRGGAFTRALKKASPALSAPLQPKNDSEVNKTREKLNMAGFRGENAPQLFWSLKTIGLAVGFFLGGGTVLAIRGADTDTLTYAGVIGGLMFYAPELAVMFIKRSRQDNIFYGLPDALDLMVVCVEAGLGLDQAMRKVSEEMKKSYGVIAEEFALCNLQLQMGRARNEVLHDLGGRTGVDDLKALAAILIQADKFGSSVAQALRVQSDSMRTRRRQLAEEKAAKTAVKLIFPLVIFIFPAIFVVLVGPAAITMINELFPSMNKGS